MWPPTETAATGVLKIVKRKRQYPSTALPDVPPYAPGETLLYETLIEGQNNKHFSLNFLHNFKRGDMMELRASKTSETQLLMQLNVVVDCLSVSTSQPYFRFTKSLQQTPQHDAPAEELPADDFSQIEN